MFPLIHESLPSLPSAANLKDKIEKNRMYNLQLGIYIYVCVYKRVLQAEMLAHGSVQHPELRAANEILVRNLSSSAQRQSRMWQPHRTVPAPQALALVLVRYC